jgi:hypothetical protein
VPVFRDRVKDTTTTTGQGDITLSGTAPSGFQSFNTAFGVGNPFLYCIVGGAEWETGTGTLLNSTTMVRDTYVMDGSSGPGVLVNFSAGTKDVVCTITSHWLEDTDNGAILHKMRGMDMP